MQIVDGSSIILENLVFWNGSDSTMGGAIQLVDSTLVIKKCEFNANRAAQGGEFHHCDSMLLTCVSFEGAISARGSSSLDIESTNFTTNGKSINK